MNRNSDRFIKFIFVSLKDSYTLEFICGGSSVFPTQERMASVLVNLVLPLCIRMGSGRTRRGENSFFLSMIENFDVVYSFNTSAKFFKTWTGNPSMASTYSSSGQNKLYLCSGQPYLPYIFINIFLLCKHQMR